MAILMRRTLRRTRTPCEPLVDRDDWPIILLDLLLAKSERGDEIDAEVCLNGHGGTSITVKSGPQQALSEGRAMNCTTLRAISGLSLHIPSDRIVKSAGCRVCDFTNSSTA